MKWSVLLLAALFAVGASPKAAPNDEEKFQGNWIVASAQKDGQPVPEEVLKNMKVVVLGNHYVFHVGGNTEESTFTLHPDQAPKSVDIELTTGPNKGKTVKGIYEIENDTLKAAFASAGEERPTTFASEAGSGHSVYVLRRPKS